MSKNSTDLETKILKSKDIILKALNAHKNKVAVMWSGGKDSTSILYMIKEIYNGKIPLPVIHLDTSLYSNVLYKFRDRITEELDLHLIIETKEQLNSDEIDDCIKYKFCKLKEKLLVKAIKNNKFSAIITGVKSKDQINFKDNNWLERENMPLVKINPIIDFTEYDIWKYIRKKSIKYCELYNYGFIDLKCIPCMGIYSKTKLNRILASKEEEIILKRMKALGYM